MRRTQFLTQTTAITWRATGWEYRHPHSLPASIISAGRTSIEDVGAATTATAERDM